MAHEGLPPDRRGEKGPLGSSNAMAETDTSPDNHAVKKDEQPAKRDRQGRSGERG